MLFFYAMFDAAMLAVDVYGTDCCFYHIHAARAIFCRYVIIVATRDYMLTARYHVGLLTRHAMPLPPLPRCLRCLMMFFTRRHTLRRLRDAMPLR